MSVLSNWLDTQAAGATQAAVNQASATPFNVIISVDQETQVWITALVIGAVILFVKRGKL
jgi:hypothetical protein